MRRQLRRCTTLACLAALLLGGVAYLARDPVRDQVARLVSTWLSQRLQGTVEIGALRGSLFSTLHLRDVVLRDRAGVTLLRLEEAHLTYDLWAMVSGRWRVHTVHLRRPQVALLRTPEGAWPLAQMFAALATSVRGSLPRTLVLDTVEIADAQLTLQEARLPGLQQLTAVQARLYGQFSPEGFQLDVYHLSGYGMPAAVTLESLRGRFTSEAQTLRLTAVQAQTTGTQLMAQGLLPGGTQPASLALQVQPFDVTELGRLLQRDDVAGLLRLALTAEGPAEALALHGQLSTAGGQVDWQAQLNTSATPWRYQGHLALTHVNLTTLWHWEPLASDLTLRVELDGHGTTAETLHGALSLEVQASRLGAITLHPSRVHVTVDQGRVVVQQCDVQTSVGRLSATGSLDRDGEARLQYDLQADLAGVRALLQAETLQGHLRLHGQASGTLSAFHTEGMLSAEQVQYATHRAERLQVQYRGQPLGPDAGWTTHLAAQRVQLAQQDLEQLAVHATYSSAARHLAVRADGAHAAGYQGNLSGQWAWTETAQELTLDTLLVSGPEQAWRLAAPATLRLEDGGARLTPLRLVQAEAQLSLAGAFDGTHFQEVRLQVTKFDLALIQPWLALAEPVAGRVSGQVQLAGTRTAPVFEAALHWQPPSQSGQPTDVLQATFRYAQQRLHGDVRLHQGQREVVTLSAQLPLDLALTPLDLAQRLPQAAATLHLRLHQPDLAALARWQPTWPLRLGTVHGELTMQGPYTALALAADVRLQHWGLRGSFEDVSTPLSLHATLGLWASDGSQHGERRHVRPHLQHLTLQAPRLRGFVPGSAAGTYQVEVQDLFLQAAGQWSAAGFEARLERAQAQVTLADWPRTEVYLAGRLASQRLDLTQLHVRLPHAEVHGSGTLTWPQPQLHLALEVPRLRLDALGVTPPAAWPAVAQGSLTVHGSLAEPRLEAHWRYAGAQLYTELTAHLQEPMPRYQLALRLETHGATLLPGLSAQLKASLTGSTVQLEEMQVRSTPLTVKAHGVWSTTAPTALTYDATIGDLTSVQHLLTTPVHATGRYHGTVQGLWPALHVRSHLDLRAWRSGPFQGQRLQAELSLLQWPAAPQLSLKAQAVDLHAWGLAPSTVTLTGNTTLVRGTLQAQVTAGPYRQTSLEGQWTRAATHRVTITRLHLQHQKDLRWDNAAPLTIEYGPAGDLKLDGLLLRHGRQEIRGRGILMPDGNLEADLHLQRVLLLPHLRAFAAEESPLDGELTLQLRLYGTARRPQGDGVAHLTALRWQQYSVGEIHSQVRLRETAVGVDLRWHDRKREFAHLTGDISLDPGHPLALRLQVAQLEAQLLTTLSPAVAQSAGIVQADVQVTGTLQQPQAHGTVRLSDGLLQLRTTGVRYRDIQMQLTCQGTQVALTRLHAASGDGTLEATGTVALRRAAFPALALELRLQRFLAVHTPALEAEVSAALALQGTLDDMQLTGTITLPKARAQWAGTLAGGRATVQPWQLTVEGVYGAGPPPAQTVPTASAPARPDPWAFLRTELQIDLPRNAWVRGPGTAIELQGTVMATKARGEPFRLSGRLETLRGFASFYSGQFVVEQGHITFPGSTDLDPLLDVVLSREVSNYVVAINARGHASTPQLHLSSTPDLPQADIVTLLVVGKTTDRLTAAERSGLSNQAQQIVGNVAAGELEQLLAKPLGLDSLDVQTGDKLGNGKVSVGRYITQDIFLSYERQLGNDNSNKVGVEYSINRHLKLKGSSSNTGDAALDILWRIDY